MLMMVTHSSRGADAVEAKNFFSKARAGAGAQAVVRESADCWKESLKIKVSYL